MAAKDKYTRRASGQSDPVSDFAVVTPADSGELAFLMKALWVGTGGTVIAVNEAGVAVTFKNVPSGSLMCIRPQRINATGTTAADLVGLY